MKKRICRHPAYGDIPIQAIRLTWILIQFDVYVRSSDDNSTFEPDFRIYNNKRDKANSKIVMPIDSNKTQAYFNLGVVKGRSPKSYYITEEALSLIQVYMPMVGSVP